MVLVRVGGVGGEGLHSVLTLQANSSDNLEIAWNGRRDGDGDAPTGAQVPDQGVAVHEDQVAPHLAAAFETLGYRQLTLGVITRRDDHNVKPLGCRRKLPASHRTLSPP
jgi:hypothetical protein